MNRRSFLTCLLGLVLLAGGCRIPPKAGIQALCREDVAYGTHERNRMDVCLPAGRTPNTPFVILIHGGAWTMAGKEFVNDFKDSLFQNGIAVASINHRYADDQNTHYPEMLADVEQAVSYCAAHAKAWNTRSDGFSMAGVSSGGHLALLYAYTTTRKISRIAEFCGPVNFTEPGLLNYATEVGLIEVIEKMTGKKYQADKPLAAEYFQASPVKIIRDIPTLIIHGTADPVVPYKQSEQLYSGLQKQGIRSKLITIPDAGHDLNMKDPANRKLIYGETVKWFKQ